MEILDNTEIDNNLDLSLLVIDEHMRKAQLSTQLTAQIHLHPK